MKRIAEIHQHKGNSECLTAYGDDNADCEFEYANILPQWHAVKPEDLPEAQRNQFRRSYYRTVLARGLQTYEKAGFNPLQLGAIASTDTHAGTPGYVQEKVGRARREWISIQAHGCRNSAATIPAAWPRCGLKKTRARVSLAP